MVGCKRCACFWFQRLEHCYAINSSSLGDFPNSTGADYICDRGLEYNLIAFEKCFIDVRGSIRRIAKILVEFLFHVPRRRRFNFLTHCSVPENLSIFLVRVLSFVSGCFSLSLRAKAQLRRRYLRSRSSGRCGLPVAFRTSRLSVKNSLPGGHALRRHVIVS